ncbi:hypothetical protein RYX36_007556 [Vicia faba]
MLLNSLQNCAMFAIRVVILAFVLHLRSAITSFKVMPRSCFTSFDQSKPTKMHIVFSVFEATIFANKTKGNATSLHVAYLRTSSSTSYVFSVFYVCYRFMNQCCN